MPPFLSYKDVLFRAQSIPMLCEQNFGCSMLWHSALLLPTPLQRAQSKTEAETSVAKEPHTWAHPVLGNHTVLIATFWTKMKILWCEQWDQCLRTVPFWLHLPRIQSFVWYFSSVSKGIDGKASSEKTWETTGTTMNCLHDAMFWTMNLSWQGMQCPHRNSISLPGTKPLKQQPFNCR